MYNPNHFNVPNNGWVCSKCGRSYAPYVQECVYCNSPIIKYLDSTTAKPEWIYKEDTQTGSIYDNEWWKHATNFSYVGRYGTKNGVIRR